MLRSQQNNKLVLEKHNKELKGKLEEVEKAKDATLALESKLEDKRRHSDQYKAENEEDGDLWVVDEDTEEEVGEDAEDWNLLSPEKLDEVREQKQAEQQTQLEEMED